MSEQKLLKLADKNKKLTTKVVADAFGFSRQTAHRKLNELVNEGKLIKIGKTRSTFYTTPDNLAFFEDGIVFKYKNEDLKEHKILDDVYAKFPKLLQLEENVRSIFAYAFSEMLNNAIEHSKSKMIEIKVTNKKEQLMFSIKDSGIGVFKNIMQKYKLKSEIEAIQELLKGKTTTQPKAHSGEGIFFTSKIADHFQLDSYEKRLQIDNLTPDIFISKIDKNKKGTLVTFTISANTKKHLGDLFSEYTANDDDKGFNKTKIHVKLFTYGTVHVSRSQARRISVNLDKFKSVILDFDKVPTIGQAFADEIFRVFQNSHPGIKIETLNTNEAVEFMINRAKS